MPLRRVLPDTNACYPISLLDLILRLDEAALHRVIWTEDLLEELARTWVDKGARSRESATPTCNYATGVSGRGGIRSAGLATRCGGGDR